MELGASRLEAGIWSAQVGDPQADGLESVRNRARSDRLVLLAVGSVSHAEDDEEAEFVLRFEVTEGAGLVELLTEGVPDAKDLGVGGVPLGGVGSVGDLQSKAEISAEVFSVARVNIFQGFGCG